MAEPIPKPESRGRAAERGPLRRGDPELIRSTAAAMLARIDDVALHVGDRVLERLPDIVDESDELATALFRASARANVAAILTTGAHGLSPVAAEMPEDDLALIEVVAQDEEALPLILRAYRLGGEQVWQLWVAQVARQVGDVAQLDRLSRASSAHVALYVDRVSAEIADRWVAATRTAARAERRQAAALRALVAGRSADLADLAHPLDRPQVVVGLQRLPATPARVATRVGRLLGERLGDPPRIDLASPDDRTTSWWAVDEAPTPSALDALLEGLPAGVWCVALVAPPGPGAITTGAADAGDALRALRRTRPAGASQTYASVALLATLLADEGRAERFARSVLGPLAAPTPQARRLRVTLRAYFEAGGRHAPAAAALGVHEKTVAHRLRRAEALLGAPLALRRTELAPALEVLRALA